MHCEKCRYFKREVTMSNIKDSNGNCHRFPPTAYPAPTANGQIAVITIHPVVDGLRHWCGEFDEKLAVP